MKPCLPTRLHPSPAYWRNFLWKGLSQTRLLCIGPYPPQPEILPYWYHRRAGWRSVFTITCDYAHYRLIREDFNGNAEQLKTWSGYVGEAITYTDTSAKAGLTYRYYVVPVHKELSYREQAGLRPVHIEERRDGTGSGDRSQHSRMSFC